LESTAAVRVVVSCVGRGALATHVACSTAVVASFDGNISTTVTTVVYVVVSVAVAVVVVVVVIVIVVSCIGAVACKMATLPTIIAGLDTSAIVLARQGAILAEMPRLVAVEARLLTCRRCVPCIIILSTVCHFFLLPTLLRRLFSVIHMTVVT